MSKKGELVGTIHWWRFGYPDLRVSYRESDEVEVEIGSTITPMNQKAYDAFLEIGAILSDLPIPPDPKEGEEGSKDG